MTRLSDLPRAAAAGLLVLLTIVIAAGLWLSAGPVVPRAPTTDNDLALYQTIVQQVRAGEPYEKVATDLQRVRNYPVKPFVVVRPPALALALARLPSLAVADGLLAALGVAVIAAWTVRLHAVWPGRLWLGWSALAVFTGVASTLAGHWASLLHETWAGLFIALSLALRGERRFTASAIVGLLAGLVRELAMPYLLVMAVLALMERRRAEAAAFALALLLSLGALAVHAHAMAAYMRPNDPTSATWLALGGWPFALTTARWNIIAIVIGNWAAAILLPLALLGAANWKDPTGLRLAALLFGYTAGFLVIGRTENDYWGLLVAPLVGVGLALRAPAVADLAKRAISKADPTAD